MKLVHLAIALLLIMPAAVSMAERQQVTTALSIIAMGSTSLAIIPMKTVPETAQVSVYHQFSMELLMFDNILCAIHSAFRNVLKYITDSEKAVHNAFNKNITASRPKIVNGKYHFKVREDATVTLPRLAIRTVSKKSVSCLRKKLEKETTDIATISSFVESLSKMVDASVSLLKTNGVYCRYWLLTAVTVAGGTSMLCLLPKKKKRAMDSLRLDNRVCTSKLSPVASLRVRYGPDIRASHFSTTATNEWPYSSAEENGPFYTQHCLEDVLFDYSVDLETVKPVHVDTFSPQEQVSGEYSGIISADGLLQPLHIARHSSLRCNKPEQMSNNFMLDAETVHGFRIEKASSLYRE